MPDRPGGDPAGGVARHTEPSGDSIGLVAGIDRLKRLLGIYEDAPFHRIGALLVFVAGMALLLRLSPIALLPFLLLVWANAPRLALKVHGLLETAPWLLVAIPAAAIVARLVIEPPAASDDLLRHIIVAYWPDGYRGMFVHTSLPPHELYPAFDGALGLIAHRIGPLHTMWLVQGVAFASYSFAVIGAGLRTLEGHPDRWFWAAGVWLLLCSLLAMRLSLARPELFMAAWAIAALIPRRPLGFALWAVVGALLGTAYWLAPVYYAAALLLVLPLGSRIAIAATLGAFWLSFWIWHTGGELISTIAWTLEAVRARVPGMSIGENASIFAMLSAPEFAIAAVAAVWSIANRKADRGLLLVIGYFLLANQVRYANVVAPLMVLCFLGWVSHSSRIRLPAANGPMLAARPLLGALLLFVGLSVPPNVPKYAGLPRFALPPGAVLLAGDLVPMYATLFHNPGAIKVSPAFEVGAARPEVQEVILDLRQGQLDCEGVLSLGFTHLVENTYEGRPAPCMTLAATQGGWRLWRLAPR